MRRSVRSVLLVLLVTLTAVSAPGERPANAAFPGTAGLIAFDSEQGAARDVYTIDTTTGAETNLTGFAGGRNWSPAWSPNGRRIAFIHEGSPTGGANVFTMRANGRGRTRLTQTKLPDREPAWSPDGTQIVFAQRTSLFGPFRLFAIDADGTGLRQLTTQGSGSADRSPAWSPDGSRIAFVSDRAGGLPQIYLMNADGTGQTRLTNDGLIDGNPSWSPDGTKLAFERCCVGGTSSIIVLDFTTFAQTDLTAGRAQDFQPAWSPDGARIAFVSFPLGGGDVGIWTMSADGSDRVPLTNDPSADFSPDWQPIPA